MLGSPRRKLPGRRQARVAVAAFGKHPAWRDHIDEDSLIAVGSDELKLLERWLHGAMFESFTAKNTLGDLSAGSVIELDHLIVRRAAGGAGCSITRVWKSTDYSGRSLFPMAISVDAESMGVDEALRRVLPALDACADAIAASAATLRRRIDTEDAAHAGTVDTSADRRAVRDAVESLRAQLAEASGTEDAEADTRALVHALREHPDSGPDGLGLARVYYRLERLKPLDGAKSSRTSSSSTRLWRLPRGADSLDESVRRWLAFLSFFAADGPPFTLSLPRASSGAGAGWVDLFVGDIGEAELERIFLSEEAETAESRTSYSAVDDAFIAATQATFDGWEGQGAAPSGGGDTGSSGGGGGGETPASTPSTSVPPEASRSAAVAGGNAPPGKSKRFGSRVRDWLIGGGGLLAVVALIAVLMAERPPKPSASTSSSVPAAIPPPEEPRPTSLTPVPPVQAVPVPVATEKVASVVKVEPPVKPGSEPVKEAALVAPTPVTEAPPSATARTAVAKESVLSSDAAAPKLNIAALAATWTASVAEAEASSVPVAESRARLASLRAGLEQIDLALAFPIEAAEPASATGAAKRIWDAKAAPIAADLAGAAVRESRTGNVLPAGAVEQAVVPLVTGLKDARAAAAGVLRASGELRAGAAYEHLSTFPAIDGAAKADPSWAPFIDAMTHDGLAELKAAEGVHNERSLDALIASAGAPASLTVGAAVTAWNAIAARAGELTALQVVRLADARAAFRGRAASASVGVMEERFRAALEGRLAAAPLDDAIVGACAKELGSQGPTSPVARANVVLLALKAGAPTDTSPDHLRTLAADLSRDHGIAIALPQAPVGAPKADPESFRKIGPGMRGWILESVSADLDLAVYSDGALRLEFQRATTPSGDSAYLCTTEVSVGVMLRSVERANGWKDFSKLIAPVSAGGEDSRAGVRSWQFGQRSLERLEVATVAGKPDPRAWLASSTYTYGDGAPPPPPGMNSPANYLSLAAAAYLAGSLGCRLPTSAEWLAAAAKVDRGASWNRRDPTWLRYAECVSQRRCVGEGPSTDAFRPADARSDADNRPAVTEDDGVLWFADVNSEPRAPFRHLFGNVAEWVFERSAGLDAQLAVGSPPTALADDVKRGVRDARVIGGSALSGPDIDPMTPLPVPSDDAINPLGYSDVGLRVAFSSPAGSAGSDLPAIRQAIKLTPYRTER